MQSNQSTNLTVELNRAVPDNMETECSKRSFNIAPDMLTISPGERKTVTLDLRNESDFVEIFTISIQGECVDWICIPRTNISLFPGSMTTQEIIFSVPKSAAAEPKIHSFDFVIEGKHQIHEPRTVNLPVEIPKCNDLTASLSIIEQNQNFCALDVNIGNNGNQAVRCELRFGIPGLDCLFEHHLGKIFVSAYETVFVPVAISTRSSTRPVIGKTNTFDVLATLTPDQNDIDPIYLRTQLIVSPIVGRRGLISFVATAIFITIFIALVLN